MKNHLLLFISVFGLAACATMQPQPQFDWTGQNFDNYILKYGVPTTQVALQSGNTAYSFIKQCSYSPGIEETTVMVNPENMIIGITQNNRCPSAYEVQQEQQQNDYIREQQEKAQRRSHNKKIDKELSSINSQLSYYQTMIKGHESSLSLAKTELGLVSKHSDSWIKANMLSPHEYEEKIKKLQEELNQFNQKEKELEKRKSQLEASRL